MVLIVAGTVVGGRLASLDPFDLIWQASWVVQLVILLLTAASIISWAAIAFKWRELAGAEQHSEAFLDVYHEGSFETAYEAARELNRGPLPAIFLAAYSEMNRMLKYGGRSVDGPLDGAAADNGGLDALLFAVEGRQRESAPGLGRHVSELKEGQTGPADVTRPTDVTF